MPYLRMRSDLSQCVTCSPMCLRAVAWSHDSCSKGRTHVADFPSRQNFHNPKVDLFIHCNAKWQVRVCQTVLFLRTGNFYRSRHAEAWFNDKACRHGLHWQVKSRGFRPYLASEDLSDWAADRLARSGVASSLSPTKPAKVTIEYLANSTLVIAMREAEQASMRRRDFPKWTNRIQYWDIGETDKTAPETKLPKIESEVDNLVRNLRSGLFVEETMAL